MSRRLTVLPVDPPALLDLSGCWLLSTPDELADVVLRVASSTPGEMYATLEWAQTWAAAALDCPAI